MGYRFQFITLAGFHTLNHSMFELARGYRERGMTAYAELQEREFASEDDGFTASPAPAGGRRRLLRGGRDRDHRRRVRDDRAVGVDRGVAVPGLKALLFDVFGTCVDWRTSVAREAGRALGLAGVDWRRSPTRGAAATSRSSRPCAAASAEWVVLDVLHREALDDVLPRSSGLDLSPEPERARAHARLAPARPVDRHRPRAHAAEATLGSRPCSNGHMACILQPGPRRRSRGTPSSAPRSPARTSPLPRVYLRERRGPRPRAGGGDDGRRPRQATSRRRRPAGCGRRSSRARASTGRGRRATSTPLAGPTWRSRV